MIGHFNTICFSKVSSMFHNYTKKCGFWSCKLKILRVIVIIFYDKHIFIWNWFFIYSVIEYEIKHTKMAKSWPLHTKTAKIHPPFYTKMAKILTPRKLHQNLLYKNHLNLIPPIQIRLLSWPNTKFRIFETTLLSIALILSII